MKKRMVLRITVLLLASLMILVPLTKAATYYMWDNVHFVEGQYIKYPHPDRDYYGISPYQSWSMYGANLRHEQVNSATSVTLVASAAALCTFLGAVLGVKIGSPYGVLAGVAIGLALGVVITYVSEAYFLDEHDCIWWWVSLAFMNWCIANAYTLWLYAQINPSYATVLVLSALYSIGYIRVGAVTFLDAIGIGNPSPPNYPPATPSTPSGPTSGIWDRTYAYSTKTTDPNGDQIWYQFSWGDGTTTTVGPYASGVTASASHCWGNDGSFYVKVRAKDSYGAWSGWSGSLKVTLTYTCPTLFSWNGSAFEEEGLLDIHAPSDVTVDYALSHLTPLGKLCLLSLRELDNYTSHIDYVKLFAVDAQGNRYECRLTFASHSQLGPVTTELRYDDNTRVDLTPGQTTELRFTIPGTVNNVQSFIFEINGYNPKPQFEP